MPSAILRQSILAAVLATVSLSAQADRSTQLNEHMITRIEQSLRDFIGRETAQLGGRVELQFGSHRARFNVPACENIEPYVPAGAKLWGRANIGLRCLDAKVRWNIYVPIEVRVFVPIMTAARPLIAGQSIEADDYLIRELDVTREPIGVLTDPREVESRITSRPVPIGAALRSDMLKHRPVIASGDHVKVVYRGSGFTIGSEGKALGSAASGQTLRVQLESGRIINGMAGPGPIVEMR